LETFTQLPKYFYILIYNWNNELLLLQFYSHYTEQPELASKRNEELEDFAEANFFGQHTLDDVNYCIQIRERCMGSPEWHLHDLHTNAVIT